jgi:hypothetical protein
LFRVEQWISKADNMVLFAVTEEIGMRSIVCALSVCLLMVAGIAQASVIIGQDNFDGTTTYLTRNFTAANTGILTWDVVSRTTTTNANILDTSKYLANGGAGDGTDTLGFLESTKTDSFFGLYRGGLTAPRTLTYTFNIAGYTNLNLAMDWAASADIPDPGIKMAYSIDGAAATTNFVIGTSGTDWIQTMEDGRAVTNNRSATVTVNGVAGTSLSDVFQTYTPTIAGTGSVLTLTLTMASNVGGPAYGMDNLKLSGTAIPEPATIGMLGLGAIITLLVRRMKI